MSTESTMWVMVGVGCVPNLGRRPVVVVYRRLTRAAGPCHDLGGGREPHVVQDRGQERG
jgi:hypothetical protein